MSPIHKGSSYFERGHRDMPTVEVDEEMLKSNGWAYQFDLAFLDGDTNDINNHISNIYWSAIDVLSKQRSKKILKGPFLIWHLLTTLADENNQATHGYALIVTPFYQQVTGRDTDPIVETMWGYRGYLRMSSVTPILEGALPACLFQDGQVYPIELDEVFVSELSEMFEEYQQDLLPVNPGMTPRNNPIYER